MCPGVCVANRISQYCEAALDVNELCRSGLRCCVSADLFSDVDTPPKEFVLLNPKKVSEWWAGARGTGELVCLFVLALVVWDNRMLLLSFGLCTSTMY